MGQLALYGTLYGRDGFVAAIEDFDEERLYGIEDPKAPMEVIVANYAAKLEEVVGNGDSPAPDMVCKD